MNPIWRVQVGSGQVRDHRSGQGGLLPLALLRTEPTEVVRVTSYIPIIHSNHKGRARVRAGSLYEDGTHGVWHHLGTRSGTLPSLVTRTRGGYIGCHGVNVR